MDNNFFEDLGFAPASQQQEEMRARGQRIDTLITQVFNSPAGHELLEIWTSALMMKPSARGGMDYLTIGLNEGKKDFIRGILNAIKRMDSAADLPPKPRKPRKKA